MPETSDLDKPLPKSPPPPNPRPIPPWEFTPEGPKRRYTPVEWARKGFGTKNTKKRKARGR